MAGVAERVMPVWFALRVLVRIELGGAQQAAEPAMELEWFEDFLSVARTGSFSRSAEERSLTQPAFSRRIRALELALGVTLIDRSSYPTRLTPAGRLFRDTAADALRLVYAVRDELRGAASAPRDFLSFSAMHSIAVAFFPHWLRRLEPTLGPLNSRVTADNMHNCVQQLIDGNCDFLLCYAHPAMPIVLEPDRYPYRVLGQDRLIPVAAGVSGGKARFRLPGSEATPLPYLGYAAGSFLRRAVDHVLERNDPRPALQLRHENALADALKAMAMAGHGVAWLPESLAEPDLERRRLVLAGGPDWALPLEVRLYKAAATTRPEAATLWSFLEPDYASLA